MAEYIIQKKVIEWLYNIRFWIFLFFIVRLIGITNPPLEVSHNWRQSVVTMVSRNFLEIDNNILYPRVDIAGEKSGITGMEFPLLNYLIYLISEFFGYEHWYGRLINLIVSSIGLFFFYKLLRMFFQKNLAFNATLILLFSIWFTFSRKIMPDTFSMSLVITSIYFGFNYLCNKKEKLFSINLLLHFALLALGVLSKLPSAYLITIYIIPLLNQKICLKRKVCFSFFTLSSLFLPAIWYFYWFPYLINTYGFSYFFMGRNLNQGIQEISENLPQTLKKIYADAIKYIGFFFFLYGFIMAIIKKQKILLYILFLSFLGFIFIILKGGYNFAHHNYYIIPFVPIMALIASYGVSNIKYKKIALICIIGICAEGGLNQLHDFIISDEQLTLVELEKDLDKVSNHSDLILINSDEHPTPMYFSHRKGWIASDHEIRKHEYIENLKKIGLKFIVILTQKSSHDFKLEYPVVYKNEKYCIYQI